nr:uncharacterized mitochondrial protein AtMg00810-like [Tanacetum cinerariifolium]
MSFFLGLQISQSPRGIFIKQSKYASEFIQKYGLTSTDSADTPMIENKKLDEDLQGKPVDATLYNGMIGSLMYLTASRLDLIYDVYLCARIMTFITAQQTKLDLELVPKENRLNIGKCNERIPRRLKPKEETFQVVLDALALTPCYPVFVLTVDILEYRTSKGYKKFKKASPSKKDSVPVPADEEPVQKGKRVKRSAKKYLTTPTTDIIIREPPVETQSKRKEKRACSKLHLIFTTTTANVEYRFHLLEPTGQADNTFSSPKVQGLEFHEIKVETSTYRLYGSCYKKFKKAYPSKKDSVPVPADEEPVQKGKRVKRSAKKYLTTPTTDIIIREPLVETQSKRKEKVDVAHGKGIDLLSEVALTEEAQMKEVIKKSLRDFHKSYPSGFSSVAKKPPSVETITPLSQVKELVINQV